MQPLAFAQSRIMKGSLSSGRAGGKEMVDADPELEVRLESVYDAL